ncbi:caspase-1-like [Macrobrachium nipponense]|uniref:caspase-1-like n=1 Tax=Macrobrachium nipponense TaxID=159736 RepID=UPI0030C8773F
MDSGNASASAPESSQRGGSHSLSDSPDSTKIGTTNDSADSSRTTAEMPVESSSVYYNMSHKRRGLAIVISYSKFHASLKLTPRPCASHDADLCRASLEQLGYEVRTHLENPKKDELLNILKEASQYDHSDCDSLIAVFMSHGKRDKISNKEYVYAWDGEVLTSQLWENFTAENCPTLAGKPKMFFIQACRGKEGDVGVLLTKTKTTSVTDHVTIQSKKEYLIPLCTDMLIMWATYPGTYSFRSTRNSGREASVFIYFLTKILDKDGGEEDLASMLLSVTRLVGIQYESYSPDEDKNNKKQMPYTMSTLMKKIKFF